MPATGALARHLTIAAMLASALLAAPAGPARAAAPGTLISATAQPAGFHDQPNGSVLTYWTTRSTGEPVRASGALLVPDGPAPAGGWPIMAYDHGTSGLGPGCGGMSGPDPVSSQNTDNRIRYLLSRGFAVAAPDYLGLGLFDTGPHPYLELRTEATATIDMVKAARAARPDLSRTWAVTGFSQGGHAALGAANLQASVAPELDLRGVIAVDPASDIEKVVPFLGPTVPAIPISTSDEAVGLLVTILAGLRAVHPELDVDGYLTPRGREIVDAAGSRCYYDIARSVGGASVGELLSRTLDDPTFRATIDEYMRIPTTGYTAPILLLLNAADMVVPSPLHAALAAQFTAAGVSYETVVGVGAHVQLSPQMYAAMDEFTTRMLATPTVS
ncbi:lipase family protein [Nocardia crassostreae]|uniref:lipase family protein n=1 Tax=Nocardia crassostreae TaxID=53428 RepID=UPI0008341A89|nr:lipase family protein [Nocardia crassostreae]